MVCIHGQLARSCEICEAMNDHAAACEQNNRLRAKLAEAHVEIAEQARLLSMSAERETRLLAKLAECERERDVARANYQFMVDRAANEKLDGYRELGQRAADAENRADRLEAALREAPHEEMCAWVRAFRKWQSGPQATKFDAPVKELCDCWKRDALGDK